MLNMASKLTVKRGGSFRGSGVCGRRALPSAPLLPSYCLGFSAVQGLHNAADGARLRDFFNRIFFPPTVPTTGEEGTDWSFLEIGPKYRSRSRTMRKCYQIVFWNLYFVVHPFFF